MKWTVHVATFLFLCYFNTSRIYPIFTGIPLEQSDQLVFFCLDNSGPGSPRPSTLHMLEPEQNGHHVVDNIFKCIFSKENLFSLI